MSSGLSWYHPIFPERYLLPLLSNHLPRLHLCLDFSYTLACPTRFILTSAASCRGRGARRVRFVPARKMERRYYIDWFIFLAFTVAWLITPDRLEDCVTSLLVRFYFVCFPSASERLRISLTAQSPSRNLIVYIRISSCQHAFTSLFLPIATLENGYSQCQQPRT